MASKGLSTTHDTTYPDDPGDASRKAHQIEHDEQNDVVNLFDYDSLVAGGTGAVIKKAAGGLWAAGVDNSAAGGDPTRDVIVVATSDAPASVTDGADYVLPGTNDHTSINTALIAASRPVDGFGGSGRGQVLVVGPNAFVGNNNTGRIQMPPATTLMGAGPGTLIVPMFSSNTGLGAIELLNANCSQVRVSNLGIGKAAQSTSQCHGIKFVGSGDASAYSIDTGNDYFCRIDAVHIHKPVGYGIWTDGTSGGVRETQIHDCVVFNSQSDCYRIESSDNKIHSCVATSGSGHGFYAGGGNTKMTDCKAYYSDGAFDGYYIASSRAFLTGCEAQDNARHGFNIQSSSNATLVGCVADSNSRSTTTGFGLVLASNAMVTGIHVFERSQTPTSRQNWGIDFGSVSNVSVTGRVEVPTNVSGVVTGGHTSGTPTGDSFVRLVRGGSYWTGSPATTLTTRFTATVYAVG